MSVRTYIISLSLTGAAAGLGCWMFMGGTTAKVAPAGKEAKTVSAKVARPLAKAPSGIQRAPKAKTPPPAAASGSPLANAAARNALPSPAVEPATPAERAARVEQEANHELKRLVTLLNLDESQQDRIFQTLAENSRYWSPEMQIAAPGAASAGKRSHPTEGATGGVFIPVTELPAATVPGKTDGPAPAPANSITTIGATSPNAGDNAKIDDPMSEIMSLLTPEQQQALLDAESDKAAWWAEILPDILPADDVPNIDGNTPGDTKEYEGSDKLE